MTAPDEVPPRPPFAPRLWPKWLALGVMVAAARLPWLWQRAIGRGVGWLALRLAGTRRRAAQVNIDLCFPDEPPADLRVPHEVRVQRLDRHEAVAREVLGAIHDAHATFADHALHEVTLGDPCSGREQARREALLVRIGPRPADVTGEWPSAARTEACASRQRFSAIHALRAIDVGHRADSNSSRASERQVGIGLRRRGRRLRRSDR